MTNGQIIYLLFSSGDLRFSPPNEATPWTETRNATKAKSNISICFKTVLLQEVLLDFLGRKSCALGPGLHAGHLKSPYPISSYIQYPISSLALSVILFIISNFAI